MTIAIMTDSTADLPVEWTKEQGVEVLGLTITLDGVTYETVGDGRLTSQQLLDQMAAGGLPTTSQVNVGQFEAAFSAAVQEGKEVLYLGFSAALSGTYQSAVIAKEMVCDQYPHARIEVVDTKAASVAVGHLVMEAVAARAAGHTLDALLAQLEELIPRLRTYLLVDDLNHLVRGGRLSKTSAVIGGLVNIKPLLAINGEGALEPIAKIRGKKKAIKELVQLTLEGLDQAIVRIAYTGERKAAEGLKEQLLSYPEIDQVEIEPLGPVIASHTGTGVLALVSVNQAARP